MEDAKMALGLARRQGWWRSCSAGAIFPGVAGGALRRRFSGPGPVQSGSRCSHASGSVCCYGGRGRTSELRDRIALFSPMPPDPKDRQQRGGSGILLLGADGFPSCAHIPAASIGLRGSGHSLLRPETRRFCVSWPSWGHGTEAFLHPVSILRVASSQVTKLQK